VKDLNSVLVEVKKDLEILKVEKDFFKIAQIIKQKNNDLAAQKLEHSIQVIEVLEQALDSANIKVGPSQK
jgi:ribosomal protein L32E